MHGVSRCSTGPKESRATLSNTVEDGAGDTLSLSLLLWRHRDGGDGASPLLP